MNAPTKPLPLLVAELRAAKAVEAAAAADRLNIEAQILSHFPSDKLEGSITDADNGVTVAYKVTRKVDTEAIQAAWGGLSTNVQKAIKWKAEVDTKAYKAIQEMDPIGFAVVAKFVTTTPAKPAVTLKG